MAFPPYSGKMPPKDFLPASPTELAIPRLRSLPRRISRFLAPSFLSRDAPPPIDRPTDFLDGMRGYASLIVFITHCVCPLHPNYGVGFWGNDGVNDYWLTQLPIIRLFHSGLACVHLFFVLSGFSISLKPLKLMRRGACDALFDSLVSATFRRAVRLYLPCLALLLGVLVLVCLGCFDYGNQLAKKENWPFLGISLQPPPVFPTWGAQFRSFWRAFWQWSDPVRPLPIPLQASQLVEANELMMDPR